MNSGVKLRGGLEGLNPEQADAVRHNEGPLLILAGAGSGKTTVLVHRTGRLIDEGIASADQILLLTFTNKAAREIKSRVESKLNNLAKKLWAGTFHSFGLEVLKKHFQKAGLPEKFGIIDQSDAVSIVKELLGYINHQAKSNFDAEKLLTLMSDRAANTPVVGVEPEYLEILEALLPRYQSRLKALGVVDFDGLLLKPIELFTHHPEILEEYHSRFKYFMVDEFQDTNHLQMKLIRLLSQVNHNLTVVGDDDQAIYGWRGAEIEHILNFPKQYSSCKVVKLVRNYRSYEPILKVANHVIKHNTTRHPKELIAVDSKGQGELPEIFIYENELEESEAIITHIRYFLNRGFKHDDICVLYRSNSQGVLMETAFRKSNIPYKITGGTGFFNRKEIKDVLAYLSLMVRPQEIAMRRVLNVPPRGLGDKTIAAIEHLAKDKHLTFFQASKRITDLDLSAATSHTLEEFHTQLQKGKHTLLAGTSSAEKDFLHVLEQFQYKKLVINSFKDLKSGIKRWELIEVFARVLDAFFQKGGRNEKSLLDFMEAMSLGDIAQEDSKNSEVQLMTLHACKGLEFSVVILVGAEEDIIPHRTLGSDISEERRLFYVGLTRARKHLLLTRCRQRNKHGRVKPSAPSRFLLEIPADTVIQYESGYRPMTELDRKQSLQDLFKKLDQSTATHSLVS